MLRNEAGKTHRMVSSMMEQLSMFDYKETMSPLASRLRPESLETFVGQKHLLGERREDHPGQYHCQKDQRRLCEFQRRYQWH